MMSKTLGTRCLRATYARFARMYAKKCGVEGGDVALEEMATKGVCLEFSVTGTLQGQRMQVCGTHCARLRVRWIMKRFHVESLARSR